MNVIRRGNSISPHDSRENGRASDFKDINTDLQEFELDEQEMRQERNTQRDQLDLDRRKMLIRIYFENEEDPKKRKNIYNRLMMHYHPDKNQDLDQCLTNELVNYLNENKTEFKTAKTLHGKTSSGKWVKNHQSKYYCK